MKFWSKVTKSYLKMWISVWHCPVAYMEWYLNCSQITSSFLLGCQNKNRANAIIAHDVIKSPSPWRVYKSRWWSNIHFQLFFYCLKEWSSTSKKNWTSRKKSLLKWKNVIMISNHGLILSKEYLSTICLVNLRIMTGDVKNVTPYFNHLNISTTIINIIM